MLHRICLLSSLLLMVHTLQAEDDFERPPISYSVSEPDNAISRLQQRIDASEAKLNFEEDFGYLRALLTELKVPVESQGLVFSKTSLQLRRISPRTPRAIYFNDEVYVGYCHAGDVLEISAVDPQLGTVFYTLSQRPGDVPARFQRQTDNCLICHSSSRTESVPGHLVRSLHVDRGGSPLFSAGSRNVNHTTPFEQRWGGWYVTGEHGDQKHLGNFILGEDKPGQQIENREGQNVTSLTDRFNTSHYLSPHSDIVALMLLEHQVLVHNRITAANFTTRQALDYDKMMSKFLEKPAGEKLDSTTRRIQQAGDKLLEALLFVDEAKLSAPVRGTSGLAGQFAARGPKDSQGRSLFEFDLNSRMFKYPCSHLIYSPAFQQLPADVRDYVWLQLGKILAGEGDQKKYGHLSAADRQAITEILRETVPQLAENWPAGSQ